jgi:hypothetical protein
VAKVAQPSTVEGKREEIAMQPMKFFLDTHDQRSSTFPGGLSREQFAEFFAKYEKACRNEGVVVLRAHVGIEAGRAYCFNMAESAEQVKRSHDAVGLAFETITEVATATPGDLTFKSEL